MHTQSIIIKWHIFFWDTVYMCNMSVFMYVCISMWLYVCLCVSVDVERYNCMMPVMITMLEKCEHMLNTGVHLPGIPHSSANPAFCDDFRSYLQSNEWKLFMKKQASYSCWFNDMCLFSDRHYVVFIGGLSLLAFIHFLLPWMHKLIYKMLAVLCILSFNGVDWVWSIKCPALTILKSFVGLGPTWHSNEKIGVLNRNQKWWPQRAKNIS